MNVLILDALLIVLFLLVIWLVGCALEGLVR